MVLEKEIRGAVAVLTFNRPEAMNAINQEVLTALDRALDEIQADDAVGAVVLTGAGERAFVAGADITQFTTLDIWSAGQFAERSLRLFRRIELSPKPVIAAINGFCLGGGCELALSCDIRLASEGARLGQPEVNLGIIPGWGGTQRLQRLVGPGWARQIVFSGEMIDARTAERIGLVNEVLPADRLLDRALDLGQRIGGRARRAVALAKEAMLSGAEMPLAEGLRHETAMWQLCFATEDRAEGVAAFLEKRPAHFTGR